MDSFLDSFFLLDAASRPPFLHPFLACFAYYGLKSLDIYTGERKQEARTQSNDRATLIFHPRSIQHRG